MLGFVAAIGAEANTHKGLLQQLSIAPLSIAATFLIFTGNYFPLSDVATLTLLRTPLVYVHLTL